MFSHVSVILSTGGEVWQVDTPRQADIPLGRNPPGRQTHPWQADTPGRQTPLWQEDTSLAGRHPVRQTPPGQTPWQTDTLHGRHTHTPWADSPWADTSWQADTLQQTSPWQAHTPSGRLTPPWQTSPLAGRQPPDAFLLLAIVTLPRSVQTCSFGSPDLFKLIHMGPPPLNLPWTCSNLFICDSQTCLNLFTWDPPFPSHPGLFKLVHLRPLNIYWHAAVGLRLQGILVVVFIRIVFALKLQVSPGGDLRFRLAWGSGATLFRESNFSRLCTHRYMCFP